MIKEGHEIGNHSWSHRNLRTASVEALKREVRDTHTLIIRITGRPPVAFRPPYGSLTSAQKRLIETEFQVPVVLWSVDTFDWKSKDPAQISAVLRDQTVHGSIILAHDLHPHALAALKQTANHWRGQGLQAVTLGERNLQIQAAKKKS